VGLRLLGHPSYRALCMSLWLLMLVLLLVSVSIGRGPLDVLQAVRELMAGEITPGTLVFTELRVPRALLGMFVGASLGLAGAAMQGLLRNPLAEPGIVGVSGCAALGAVLVFYTGLSGVYAMALPLGGIAGALVAVVLLYLLSGARATLLTVILAGIAINALAGALTALVLNLAPSPFAFLEIIFWQMGSLSDRSLQHVGLSLPLMLVGWGLLLGAARGLEALSLGEETAVSLGVNLGRLRLYVIMGSALAVGSAVAVSGVIGFVGLVVPHLLRPWVDYLPGKLLPISALGGAILVLAADILVRLMPTQNELKLGVVTALIGAPFFLWLVYRLRREMI
jgi:iron complex transport system permease protein